MFISDYYIFQDTPSQQWGKQGKIGWDWQKHMPWEHFSRFLARIKDLSSLHLTWPSCVNLMQHVVFCHMAMDAYREFQFMKLSHVESDVFLAPVICFLPSCFQQFLDSRYLSCSPLGFTIHDWRRTLFPSSHLTQGLSLKPPGDWQRPFCHLAVSLTEGQEQDSQSRGMHNPTHAHSCDHSQHMRSGKHYLKL